jgi:hypothetical protein
VPVTTPFLVRARVKVVRSEDGAIILKEDVKVGDLVIVDLYSKKPALFLRGGVPCIVPLLQSVEDGGWFPMEFLELNV